MTYIELIDDIQRHITHSEDSDACLNWIDNRIDQWRSAHPHDECQAKLDGILNLFRNSVPMANFLRERQRIAFQMQGRYDGSMDEECKALFAEEYRILSELVDEL